MKSYVMKQGIKYAVVTQFMSDEAFYSYRPGDKVAVILDGREDMIYGTVREVGTRRLRNRPEQPYLVAKYEDHLYNVDEFEGPCIGAEEDVVYCVYVYSMEDQATV